MPTKNKKTSKSSNLKNAESQLKSAQGQLKSGILFNIIGGVLGGVLGGVISLVLLPLEPLVSLLSSFVSRK